MDLTAKTVTITRPSAIDGRPFTRDVTIQAMWTTYNGIELGTPVKLYTFPFYEILSDDEVATAR